jgi:hypothetical protein
MLQTHLTTICQELGLSMPPLTEKEYTLTLNPAVSLSIRHLDPGCALSARIALCPTKNREELFLHLMSANFLGQGTGSARIGLSLDEKFLTLSRGFPYEMNYQDFKEKVEEFVNYLLYWREELMKWV